MTENKIKESEKQIEAEKDPVGFLTQNKDPVLFGYFLNNSKSAPLLTETIKEIDLLKDERNIGDLIDFLMNYDDNSNEGINLKILSIKVISNYKDKRAIPVLLYCLNDKNANYKMRFQAAVALGKIGDKNAVESLINIVSDEDEKSVYVRESAAEALGMIGDMRAIDPLLTILEAKKNFLDKFTFLKERVIEALNKISFANNERSMRVLKNALEDDSAQVRIDAVECLMNFEDEEAFELIKTKLKDENKEVIKNAVAALYNMKGKEALFEILKDKTLSLCAKDEANNILREYEDE